MVQASGPLLPHTRGRAGVVPAELDGSEVRSEWVFTLMGAVTLTTSPAPQHYFLVMTEEDHGGARNKSSEQSDQFENDTMADML